MATDDNVPQNIVVITSTFMRRTAAFLELILILFAVGCSTVQFKPEYHRVPYEHTVMLNSNGLPVDPTGNVNCTPADTRPADLPPYLCFGDHDKLKGYAELSETNYRAYIADILESIRKSGRHRILFFIHGGLNDQIGTIERATYMSHYIESRDSDTYPIFINWRSSFTSNYLEHLLFVRQGEYQKSWGPLLSPFYLATDLARAVVRAPIVDFLMFRSDWQSSPTSSALRQAEREAERLAYEADVQPNKSIAFIRGDDRRTHGERVRAFWSYVATVPSKLATAPVLDAGGTNSWNSMIRRTRTIFHTDSEFRNEPQLTWREYRQSYAETPADGGLSVFCRQLARFIAVEKSKKPSDPYEIVLVGHSMGTFVLNEILRDFVLHASRPDEELPVTNIVYMAAACPLRDYEDTLFPFLRQHPNAEVYHLVLHPAAEVRDSVKTDLPPRGSLLVWIDNFLSSPISPLDRTAGRFVNLVAACP